MTLKFLGVPFDKHVAIPQSSRLPILFRKFLFIIIAIDITFCDVSKSEMEANNEAWLISRLNGDPCLVPYHMNGIKTLLTP